MKRIMFICLGMNNGGVARVISILTETLQRKDYKLYILSLSHCSETYEVNECVQMLYPTGKYQGVFAKKIGRILEIRKAVKQYKIDVIIAFSHYNVMYSVLATKGLNVKIIGSERNDPAKLNDRKIMNWLRMKLYKKLDCLVCQTDEAKSYFPAKIQKKAIVIMNPITDRLPEPFKGVRAHRVVSFSRLEPQKNISMLIDAFEEFYMSHSDYVLDIYGEGSLRDDLANLVKNKKLDRTVRLQPYTTDIHNVVLNASMFALSSNYEGLSNAMLESMALGIPTIVTDCPCGGPRMVIENGVNGLLVPVGDAGALARAMSCVADNKELADKLSNNGRKIKMKLSAEKIGFEWEKIINCV